VKGENEAKGGLLDAEFKPKPAYRALDQFINKKWKTQTAVQTDAQGRAQFRGFHGTYRYVARVSGRKVEGTLRVQSSGENRLVIRFSGPSQKPASHN
jgi:hypothetical protein